MAKKKSTPQKPPVPLRARKKSEMRVYTQPAFQAQQNVCRKACLRVMAMPYPRITSSGELVFAPLTFADVARMACIKCVETVRRWILGWTYRAQAETVWKIMTALQIPTGILPHTSKPEEEAPIYSISDYRMAQLRKAKAVTETGKKAPKERRFREGTKVLPAAIAG